MDTTNRHKILQVVMTQSWDKEKNDWIKERGKVKYEDNITVSNVRIYTQESLKSRLTGHIKAWLGLATKFTDSSGNTCWINNASLKKHAFVVAKKDPGDLDRGTVKTVEDTGEHVLATNVKVYSSDSVIGRMQSAFGLAFEAERTIKVDKETNAGDKIETVYVNKASYESRKQIAREVKEIKTAFTDTTKSIEQRYQVLADCRTSAEKGNEAAKEFLSWWEKPRSRTGGITHENIEAFKAAGESNPEVLYDAARFYNEIGETDNYEHILNEAEGKGNLCPAAKMALAAVYWKKKTPIDDDYNKGWKLANEAAEAGNQRAQAEVGNLYMRGGQGSQIKQNTDLGKKYLGLAAQGHDIQIAKKAKEDLRSCIAAINFASQ